MIKPLFDNILIEKVDDVKKNKGGMLLSDNKKMDAILSGKIVDVGIGRLLPDGTYDSPKVKVGEVAHFLKHECSTIDENYYIIRETSILGVS